MPKASTADLTQLPIKQAQLLENKVNKLRWINNDLNKQVFDAIQRGHRLAGKLGYQNLEEAENALATQDTANGQSQLEQLSQHPTDELASHIQSLQSELLSHVQLSKSTLSALGDALQEMSALRDENLALRSEAKSSCAEQVKQESADPGSGSGFTEVEQLRGELAALRQQHADLQHAKQQDDEKHARDFARWTRFKDWFMEEEWKQRVRQERGRSSKRRKVSSKEEDEKENGGRISPDRLPESEWEVQFGNVKRRLHEIGRLDADPPTRIKAPGSRPSKRKPTVLASRNLNSLATPALPRDLDTSIDDTSSTREEMGDVELPPCDVHASSETEPESQPVAYIYPSRIDVAAGSSTIPQKRPRSPEIDRDSSETEAESQAPSFLFPSKLPSNQTTHTTTMTPKPTPTVRRAAQLWTPVSTARPQPSFKGKEKARADSEETASLHSSSVSSDPFRPVLPRAAEFKPTLPDTPASLASRKGKGHLLPENKRGNEQDEDALPSIDEGKKRPDDYSIFKGRGRYGEELKAGKDTINALYELDPTNNNGVDFQYEEVVRDKQRRKHMHAGDCECCRDYYDAVGPLPARLRAPLWRSPESSPSKPSRRDSFGDVSAAAIEEHKQAISRHRQHWARAKTPPGYWNIGFPDTQEVAAMNAEAARMHAQKRAMVAEEAGRGGRFRRR
ncbi:DNA repair protein endonuclease SAE2/CtIP C-terminus-domain-containing protein [Trametes gibbosa]|nr:DNA repair protein endonuclease SAE2/CtIP C-terminus-domain-containing protein [Trametes gibbosa]